MELKFDREQNRNERLTFIRRYSEMGETGAKRGMGQTAGSAPQQFSHEFKEVSTGSGKLYADGESLKEMIIAGRSECQSITKSYSQADRTLGSRR